VVEVKSISKNFAKEFGDGKREVKFEHKWGKIDLVSKTFLYEATLLKKSDAALPTVKERFATRKKEVMGDSKPQTRDVVRKVALFALELGLIDECAKVMDELAESHKATPPFKPSLAVKADLEKPLEKFDQSKDAAAKWKDKLLEGYKVSTLEKHHFALVHINTAGADEIKPHFEHLE